MDTNKSFPTHQQVEDISKFVLKKQNKNKSALETVSKQWIRTAWENKMDYEVSWLGVPIIQNPYDMILMQELIFKIQPDLIIETGVAHGGSVIYYNSLLQMMHIPNAEVIGIDIEIRSHNRKLIESHPYSDSVRLIEQSSIEQKTFEEVESIAKNHRKVMVILDSNHTRDHVLAELELYSPLVTKDSYLVVFDTFMPKLEGLEGAAKDFDTNTAWHAVEKFIKKTTKFEIDKSLNKFFVSSCPDGFLKRVT